MLVTEKCKAKCQSHRLTCDRPLMMLMLPPRSCGLAGLHEVLPHRNRFWGSPGVFSTVAGQRWTEWRVLGQGCGRSGKSYDSDKFPTEARGSLAVPAVACRSGRSVVVAKTDRLQQFQQRISRQTEQLATKPTGRHDSAGARVLLLAGPCRVLEVEGAWRWPLHS